MVVLYVVLAINWGGMHLLNIWGFINFADYKLV